MPASLNGVLAAKFARDYSVETDSYQYKELSNLMCWDAVIYCINNSGAKKIGTPNIQRDKYADFVSNKDPDVKSYKEMSNVPEGARIGFIEDKGPGKGDMLIHAMISTGAGFAAGNKNSCIGMGHAIGWEVLDLRQLSWHKGGFDLNPGGVSKIIKMHYRALP